MEEEIINNIPSKIILSGSLILNRETIPIETDINNEFDGFIFSPSKQNKYDANELKKIKNVEVTELIPEDETTNLDLVPRPLYEESLEALAIAEETISLQLKTIAELENKIIELEAKIETLLEENDNERLLRILAEENYENARQEIAIIIQDSQLSYQRSILEGIEKTSYEAKYEGIVAQNEALKQDLADKQAEIDQLTKSLEGKEAQIEAGAKTNTDITANVLEKGKEDGEDLYLDSIKYNAGSDPFGDGKWINGPTVELYNFTSQKQNITFDVSGAIAEVGIWVNNIPTLVLEPNQRKTIKITTNGSAILSSKPRNRAQKAQNYRGKILVKSNTGTITLTTNLYKHKER